MPLKINLKSVLMYAVYTAAAVFVNYAAKGVPLSLGLCFAMLLCGTNLFATPILYVLASAVNFNLTFSLLSLAEAVFLAVVVFIYRKTGRKIKFESILFIVISLTPYIIFGSAPTGLESLIKNEYISRSIAAAVSALFCLFCFKSVYALLFRLQRCRLKEDELICIGVTFAVCGTGLYSLAGEQFYLCIAALITITAVRLSRSPAALISAIVTAIPHALCTLSFSPITVYIIISVIALIFVNAGRLAASAISAAGFALYTYLSGGYNLSVPYIVMYALLLFAACALPAIPKQSTYDNLKMRLLVKSVLPDTAILRSRRRTGEKLYRISEVFREIECAFLALDDDVDDEALKERILYELKESCCKTCEKRNRCERSDVYKGFKKLIDSGCARGKANLIDLPSEVTKNCGYPSDVLNALNTVLADYRRFMTELENARSGRKLLAEQAKGVAEVMKSCAVELSRTKEFSGEEEQVKKALSNYGISCPEVYLDGDGEEVCAVTLGQVNRKAMAEIISRTLNRNCVLKDKLEYDGEKSCLVFGTPPVYDAVFGVAYAIKSGEKVSGDTHSVIRINEHSFLMALSDGMGSGEYAQKVSKAAISLIEAFYRAEMPETNVLNTINKLLTFNRDERFTCIDIAAVNLDSGRADFVKIGSPAGVILREGEIKILESTSLPLGILENLHPTVSTENLKNGDIIVFMSDGITSAFPSSTDMYEYLQGIHPLNPQALADTILAAALDKTGHKAVDDMTVVCTRIFENN